MLTLVRARRLVAALVVTVTAAALAAVPSPARADEVAAAQARVDRLQFLVRETTAKLTEGTLRWEADQASLRKVERRLHVVQRRVREAGDQVVVETAQASGLARRLYMHAGPSDVQVAMTKRPEQVLGALQVRNDLDQVAGDQAEIIRRATAARVRFQGQQRLAEQLTGDAQGLVRRSATRLAALDALAQKTADELVAAQNTLQQARAARAARQARERAAAERAQAARASAAEAARLARAFAAASRVFSGAPCTGRSTEGQANGNLDPASLCPLWQAPGQRLRADAAAAFTTMSQAYAASRGGPLCVTDSYRTYSEQVALYRSKPGLAAVPGTSEHGWGKAVDFCGGVESSGSAAHAWMQANAGRFGWFHPSWAEPSGSKPEPWHWEFSG